MKNQKVIEIELAKHFRFMYSNFVISSQQKLYLLLAQKDNNVDVLEFDFSVYKYGYPNDEVGHPLIKYGLGTYGFYEVKNSKWIEKLRINNSSHHSHSDDMFNTKKHCVAKFKDVTLEVIAKNYELKTLPKSFFTALLNDQLLELDDD